MSTYNKFSLIFLYFHWHIKLEANLKLYYVLKLMIKTLCIVIKKIKPHKLPLPKLKHMMSTHNIGNTHHAIWAPNAFWLICELNNIYKNATNFFLKRDTIVKTRTRDIHTRPSIFKAPH